MASARLLALAAVPLALPGAAQAAPRPVVAPAAVRVVAGAPFSLDASASAVDPGRAISSITWDFGDGTVDAGAMVTKSFRRPGTYRVEVTVADDLGATTSTVVPVRAERLRAGFAAVRVDAGLPVRLGGVVVPAERGARMIVERQEGAVWRPLTAVRTDAAGRFSRTWVAERGGTYRVRAAGSGAVSAPAALAVRVRAGLADDLPVAALAPLRASVRIWPRSYRGSAVYELRQGTAVVRRTARVRAGSLQVALPAVQPGGYRLVVWLPGTAALRPTRLVRSGLAVPRALVPGDAGPEVRALIERLHALHVYVPAPQTAYDYRVTDSVITFQKAYGLERTGVVDDATWRAVLSARPERPRFRLPRTHIEVDRTRQVLVKVIDGRVAAIIPVSTGATGNTPTGAFHVERKDEWTQSLYGSMLYRVLTYYRNFAIHGYPDVPAYPASHGCTRVPLWIVDWLWARSEPGEAVYNYDS